LARLESSVIVEGKVAEGDQHRDKLVDTTTVLGWEVAKDSRMTE
jgi:hypothetical protein